MSESYPAMVDNLTGVMRDMGRGIPDVMQAFIATSKAAGAVGALDAKTKELMAVAISVAIRCDGCIGFHVRAAHAKGVTREEMLETIGVAVMMGGGPATVYGAHALEAFDQFAAAKAA